MKLCKKCEHGGFLQRHSRISNTFSIITHIVRQEKYCKMLYTVIVLCSSWSSILMCVILTICQISQWNRLLKWVVLHKNITGAQPLQVSVGHIGHHEIIMQWNIWIICKKYFKNLHKAVKNIKIHLVLNNKIHKFKYSKIV